jgi:CRP-like cAMP-binding protein
VSVDAAKLVPSAEVRNSILSRLPAATLARLRPKLRRVQLQRNEILQDAHRSIDHIYFIQRGLAVLFARTRRDGEVGVTIIGRQGLVGVPAVLGTRRSLHRCLMEVPGEALQIAAEDFRQAMDESPPLRQQVMIHAQELLVQYAQTVLCNARHQLEERLTRWLLLAHDRLEGNTIPLTQDLLSMMLGVRRAGITTALDRLERDGAVRKRRGAVEIADRTLIEQRTCECYRVIAESERSIDFTPAEHAPELRNQLASAG